MLKLFMKEDKYFCFKDWDEETSELKYFVNGQ